MRFGCLDTLLHVCLLTLSAVWANTPSIAARCLKPKPEQTKRHFYYQGESLAITLENSHRVSHKIVNNILRIILQEELGYAKVEIRDEYNSYNGTQILNRLSGCNATYGCEHGFTPGERVPETMVNLEIWLPAGFNMEPWVTAGQIIDAGPLGPYGRFGWYIPTSMVEKYWQDHKQIVDHWRAFKMEEVLGRLDLHKSKHGVADMRIVRNVLTHRSSNLLERETFCTSPDCVDGVWRNRQCRGKHKCAVLMSSYEEVDMGLPRKQIRNLGLDIDMAWVGNHLESFVEERTREGKYTLFFGWTPDVLTATGNYTRIKFPSCKSSQHQPTNCDFTVNQLGKAMWMKMRTHTPEVHQIIVNMQFTREQYEGLLQLYMSNDQNVTDTACDWIKANRNVWSKWLPNMGSKPNIYIGGMYPIRDGRTMNAPGILPAVAMAIKIINSNKTILPDYNLHQLIENTKCNKTVSVKAFFNYVNNDTHPIAVILGPGCSNNAKSVAGVAQHFNMIVISYSADGVGLSNSVLYPSFFRTVPSLTQAMSMYVGLICKCEWKQVALLTEQLPDFVEYQSELEDALAESDVSVVYKMTMPMFTPRFMKKGVFVADSEKPDQKEVIKYLEDIKAKNVRIIILTSLQYGTTRILCEAYKQGMTAHQGYQWFLTMAKSHTDNWWDVQPPSFMGLMLGVTCSEAEMWQIIQGAISHSHATAGPKESFIVGNMTVREWDEQYEKELTIVRDAFNDSSRKMWAPNDYARHAYDAVWAFALSIDQLLREKPSAIESIRTQSTYEQFKNYLNRTKFSGASGLVQFQSGNRAGLIYILQFQMRELPTKIGIYDPFLNDSQKLRVNSTALLWYSGKRPDDGSPYPKVCNIEGFRAFLNVDCDQAIVIANILGVGLFGLVMVLCLVIVKRRYDAKVQKTRERMRQLGFLTDDGWPCLDEWEIAREHVVLNRKLGEGAFGTVYGGEAFISENWVAVAVKTLKIGSSPEEKLDFLSEAEMMKRFDHDNIVKLLGVCMRGEPAYTIMEFMLHGDLKTYLLARRHLVGQDSKEADDITPYRLTKIALDIAYGVQYLHKMRYVHRDLACRNCLVHAKKTVKIGDFGMTRPIYDNDYYKFTKRGMLPVRWMGPESLADGIFTPMSDMWSFGVLLYEIMTFGSFPYQGLSNKQVLEFVKGGNTISLPTQCNDNLRHVLIACWEYKAERRPVVKEIIELFKGDQTLLTPCLDAPLSSVAMENTGSFEVPTRGHRSSSRLRITSRTSNDIHHMNSVESRSLIIKTPTSGSIHGDPFSIVSGNISMTSAPRSRHSSSGRRSSSDKTESTCTVDGVVTREMTPSSSTTKSSSPDSPIQLHYIGPPACLEERAADSDYCSDHSKDFWNSGNTTVV